jgi:D-arabinonate dehydratase/D-galactarolactone cycloisomerase
MKITDVKAYPLIGKADKRLTGFLSDYKDLENNITKSFKAVYVKIETDENIDGWGESIVRESSKVSATIINNLFRPFLIGQDPLETEILWDKLISILRIRGHSYGFYIEALSGIDMALWDIKGKYFKAPIYKLLGGNSKEDIQSYYSSILYADKNSIQKDLKFWLDKGFKNIKIKIGEGYEKDTEKIKFIRDYVGNDINLMADANTAYNVPMALKIGRMLEKYEISWFEEPIKPDNLSGYKELTKILDIPICIAETFFSKYQWKEYFLQGAIDIVQPDIARVGGITEALKIISMSEAFEIPITFHVGLSGAGARASALHLSSIIPKNLFWGYEYYAAVKNPLVEDLLKAPIEILNKDHIELPKQNGLGIDINEEKLNKFIES